MNKGKCYHCVYSAREPTLWVKQYTLAWPMTLTCVNHPEAPGEMKQVLPGDSCRNFRQRPERRVRGDPPGPTDNGLRHIALTKGKFATVDAADYDWLMQYRWHTKSCRGRFYAATVIDGKSVTMHRLIMKPPPGKVTDHIDGNGLINTHANMRNCNPAENRRNTRPRGKRCKYVGVFSEGDHWYFKVKHNRKVHRGGPFNTDFEAAKARDKKAIELFGPFAWLNFPGDAPPIPPPDGASPTT